MKVKLRLYGDFLRYGPEEAAINIPDASKVEDLLSLIGIEERTYIITLVNLKRVWFDYVLSEGDTVSIFSPVGGG